MDEIQKRSSWPLRLAYCYLVVPVIIFFIGWLKPVFSIPLTTVILIALYSALRRAPSVWIPRWEKVSVLKLAAVVMIIFCWVYLSGTGSFVWQNWDHWWRNAIFNCLVESPWPAIWDPSQFQDLQQPEYLCYYIGFWLPAALIAKITSLQIGYLFQAIWAAAGLLILYSLVCAHLKKIAIWPLVVFVFFSGMDVFGKFLTGSSLEVLFTTEHLEWWSLWQYSGITVQLFWVFNQALPAWVACMILLLQKENRYLVFLASLMLIASPFPFVGVIPFAFYFSLRNAHQENLRVKGWFCSLFSWENVVAGGLIGILTFLYMASNLSVQTGEQNGIQSAMDINLLLNFVVFFLVECGIYLLVISRHQGKNPIFGITFAVLLLCPFYGVGNAGDFCMRASIPALFYLYLLVTETLDSTIKQKNTLVLIEIVLLLAIGAVTPIHEFSRTIVNTMTTENWQYVVTQELGTNFWGNSESLFFRLLCRR